MSKFFIPGLRSLPGLFFLLFLSGTPNAQAQDSASAGGAVRYSVPGGVPVRFHALGEGDAIRLSFFPDSAFFLNGIYPIDGEGNILLPILGKTNITKMDESDLVTFLNKVYVEHLRFPSAQVRPLIRIAFIGGFLRPGLFYADPSSSLWDALRLAGGPAREDGLAVMNWERKGEILKSGLGSGVESGRSLEELGFQSGDQIWVTARPKKYFWDKFNADVLPGLTFLVTSVTASLAIYNTYRLFYR